MKEQIVFKDDFNRFPLGPFPYDPGHSAMGEYHFTPPSGYSGNWYDPIVSYSYVGPSWQVSSPFMDSRRCMEQMRLDHPAVNHAVPTLVTGDEDWENYQVSVVLRCFLPSEPCGVLFRYQTSMMHYGFYLTDDGVELHCIEKNERIVLATAEVFWDRDRFHELGIQVSKQKITGSLDGEVVISTEDSRYARGCIALSSCMPTQYDSVVVTMSEDEHAAWKNRRTECRKEIVTRRQDVPQPKMLTSIDLKDFGAGRQIRFGHLTGTDELFFIICQHQRRVFKDRYPVISCMTAVSVSSGEVLWQIGEPRDDEDVVHLTTDLPFQIYDIDGDGVDEVIASWDFKLLILDGPTGTVRQSIDTPINVEDPSKLCGVEFGRHAFHRLNVDAIRIVNVSGKDRPSDILIKDRYSRLWVYDNSLSLLWKFSHKNTGHFPFAYDFNGDGRDEIFSCYNLVSSDGQLIWELPVESDHTDEIIIGKLDHERDEEIIAIVSGWEGFMLADPKGNILFKDVNGHGQRISTGNFCPEREGLEICTTTYWGNQGIVYLYDAKGREIWHKEPRCNGNIISPVNWDGSGTDLILLNGNIQHGGMMDGKGRVLVEFPDDGHPDLCSEVTDITGDRRDDVVLWDRSRLVVYTQDRPAPIEEMVYAPVKYPRYNASNYRGEYCFPRWIPRNAGVEE